MYCVYTRSCIGTSVQCLFFSPANDVLGSLAYHEYVMSVSENGKNGLAEYRGLGPLFTTKANRYVKYLCLLCKMVILPIV